MTKKGFVKTGNDTYESHTETIFELTFLPLGLHPISTFQAFL